MIRVDMGDPQPENIVKAISLCDHFNEDWSDEPARFYLTEDGWKGRINGNKIYLDWDEMLRRFGPLEVGR